MCSLKNEPLKVAISAPRFGAAASFVAAISFLAAPLIYLTGNLYTPYGPLVYSLADFLYGPVWASSLIALVAVLRERLRDKSPRRMTLALLAVVLAGGAMVLTACLRSANRYYHIAHPELALESNQTVLAVWATLVAGISGAGWHFFGWMQLLLGSAGWTSRRLPRFLSAALLVAGSVSLFVYAFPLLEGLANVFAVILSVWLGILLLKTNLQKKS